MKNVLVLLLLVFLGAGSDIGQNARLELTGNFNSFTDFDSGSGDYQLFTYGLKAEKLFSNHFGWHTGISIGSAKDIPVIIYDDEQFGSASFYLLEPGISFHTGQNMNGFVVDLTIRSGMQRNKFDIGSNKIKDNFFLIGPELGFGFNTTLAGDWCIGGKFGGGILAGAEYGYVHVFGGVSVSRRF